MQLQNPLDVHVTPSPTDCAFLARACGRIVESASDETEANTASNYETLFILLLTVNELRANINPIDESKADNSIKRGLAI